MKILFLPTLLLASTSLAAQDSNLITKNVNPGTLWVRGTNPLRDRVARSEGDLLTIIISESSVATYSANTSSSKNDSTDITEGLGPILKNLIPNWAIGAKSSNSGSGTTGQSSKLTAKMSAIVTSVQPNGTLTIEGARSVVVNKETQLFKITGVIRREDIRPDNTVMSEAIADAHIKLDGKGTINDRQRRGLITRLLDWLF
ncbi:MAG: Flagellar L-ring protein [Fimbriimonadaceae bacterium]|nr:Flagellar L-ring protein [Fimbriimonadaceae bacterium]